MNVSVGFIMVSVIPACPKVFLVHTVHFRGTPDFRRSYTKVFLVHRVFLVVPFSQKFTDCRIYTEVFLIQVFLVHGGGVGTRVQPAY